MKTTKKIHNCSNCKYSHIIYLHQCTDMLCRRKSPQQIYDETLNKAHALWPSVSHDDWCGKYKHK